MKSKKKTPETGYKFDVFTNKEKDGLEISFDGKPPADVLEYLKFMKFRWWPAAGYWWRKALGQTSGQVRQDLEDIYANRVPEWARVPETKAA